MGDHAVNLWYKLGSNIIIIKFLVVTLGRQAKDAGKYPASLSLCKAKFRSFPEIVSTKKLSHLSRNKPGYFPSIHPGLGEQSTAGVRGM